MKKINKDLLSITFLISALIFLNLSPSFDVIWLNEAYDRKGYGFPFIWRIADPATSLSYLVDIVNLIIDFLFIYIPVLILSILFIRKPFIIQQRKTFTLLILALSILSVSTYMLTMMVYDVTIYNLDEVEPIYNTAGFVFNILFP